MGRKKTSEHVVKHNTSEHCLKNNVKYYFFFFRIRVLNLRLLEFFFVSNTNVESIFDNYNNKIINSMFLPSIIHVIKHIIIKDVWVINIKTGLFAFVD